MQIQCNNHTKSRDGIKTDCANPTDGQKVDDSESLEKINNLTRNLF